MTPEIWILKLRLTMTSRPKKGTWLKLFFETGFEKGFKTNFETGFETDLKLVLGTGFVGM